VDLDTKRMLASPNVLILGVVAYSNHPPTFVPLAIGTYSVLLILRPLPDILYILFGLFCGIIPLHSPHHGSRRGFSDRRESFERLQGVA